MTKLKMVIIGFGILLLTYSCKTYTITTESFSNQMIHAKTENLIEVEINNPLTHMNVKYQSNHIESLIVTDKKGNKVTLYNSPSIEMRVTHRNGKKYHFYFDTVILENNFLKGGRSRFLKNLTRQIPFDSIVKIEIQKGHKKFKYQN